MPSTSAFADFSWRLPRETSYPLLSRRVVLSTSAFMAEDSVEEIWELGRELGLEEERPPHPKAEARHGAGTATQVH